MASPVVSEVLKVWSAAGVSMACVTVKTKDGEVWPVHVLATRQLREGQSVLTERTPKGWVLCDRAEGEGCDREREACGALEGV